MTDLGVGTVKRLERMLVTSGNAMKYFERSDSMFGKHFTKHLLIAIYNQCYLTIISND